MNKFLLSIALLVTFCTTSVAHDMTYFKSHINGHQEVPAVESEAHGLGAFYLDEDGLHFSISVVGLDVTGAHFHMAAKGENGPVVRAITEDAVDGTYTGVWRFDDADNPLTDELVQAFKDGEIYVNIHTEANPDGEIRGQVKLTGTCHFQSCCHAVKCCPPQHFPRMKRFLRNRFCR